MSNVTDGHTCHRQFSPVAPTSAKSSFLGEGFWQTPHGSIPSNKFVRRAVRTEAQHPCFLAPAARVSWRVERFRGSVRERDLPSANQGESWKPGHGHGTGREEPALSLIPIPPPPSPPVRAGPAHGALSAAPAACSERAGPPVAARVPQSRPRPRERPAPCSWRSWRRICTLWRKRSPQSSQT